MITINPSTCTRCYHCVKICPSTVFAISPDKSVEVKYERRCIRCGHCVAACESNSVLHDVFPPEKIHAIDTAKLPTAEQTLLLMRKRRSNRAFSTKAIPEESLSQILEAAYRAPTASNLQQVSFTLITDPEKLKLVTEFTINTFLSSLKWVDNAICRPFVKRFAPSIYNYIPIIRNADKLYKQKGKDNILRGATALLFIHAPKELAFGCEDCNLAYQNASLMAESLGVSQFYTGFVLRSTRQKRQKLEQLLGINGRIYAGMAMGMTLFECVNYIDKKDIVVSRI